MNDAPKITGFVAPQTLPRAVRLDRTWISLNRLSERHRRVGRCGCGRAKEQADHKVCRDCQAGERVHAKAAKLRGADG